MFSVPGTAGRVASDPVGRSCPKDVVSKEYGCLMWPSASMQPTAKGLMKANAFSCFALPTPSATTTAKRWPNPARPAPEPLPKIVMEADPA